MWKDVKVGKSIWRVPLFICIYIFPHCHTFVLSPTQKQMRHADIKEPRRQKKTPAENNNPEEEREEVKQTNSTTPPPNPT